MSMVQGGEFPKRVWLIWPDDGGAPVLWIEPCPFPVDDGVVTEYVLAPPQQEKPKDKIAEAVKIARGGDAPTPFRGFS